MTAQAASAFDDLVATAEGLAGLRVSKWMPWSWDWPDRGSPVREWMTIGAETSIGPLAGNALMDVLLARCGTDRRWFIRVRSTGETWLTVQVPPDGRVLRTEEIDLEPSGDRWVSADQAKAAALDLLTGARLDQFDWPGIEALP